MQDLQKSTRSDMIKKWWVVASEFEGWRLRDESLLRYRRGSNRGPHDRLIEAVKSGGMGGLTRRTGSLLLGWVVDCRRGHYRASGTTRAWSTFLIIIQTAPFQRLELHPTLPRWLYYQDLLSTTWSVHIAIELTTRRITSCRPPIGKNELKEWPWP